MRLNHKEKQFLLEFTKLFSTFIKNHDGSWTYQTAFTVTDPETIALVKKWLKKD